MKKSQYIIVGQGIAGTILSMQMTEAGIPHFVIDNPSLSSSSKVAAGIINPIVLKRLKLVKDAELFMPSTGPFYRQWETRLNSSFYFPTPIYHLLHTTYEENLWMEKSARPIYADYLGNIDRKPSIKSNSDTQSWGKMTSTAWVDTHRLIQLYRDYLKEHKTYLETSVSPENIHQIKAEFSGSKIIWCTGHLMSGLSPLSQQIFRPTRGELLIIKTSDLPQDKILHTSIFILPLGNNLFKIGATYHWDNPEDKPSTEGKEYLINELKKTYSGNYEIIGHLAGVRPNTIDRKPLLGKLGVDYVFNGLGSRGVLMAPYLADLFIAGLVNDTSIPYRYDIARFT